MALWPCTAENNFNLNCHIRTVFPYDSLIIILGKIRVFKVLDDKSIIKADSRIFWTPILVRLPYKKYGQN